MWTTMLFFLKALSDYNLRSTTMRETIFDRHLRGRYAQEEGYRAVRESGSLQGLPGLRSSPSASEFLGCLEIRWL